MIRNGRRRTNAYNTENYFNPRILIVVDRAFSSNATSKRAVDVSERVCEIFFDIEKSSLSQFPREILRFSLLKHFVRIALENFNWQ